MSKPKPSGESLLIPRQALREHAQAADARWQNSVRAFDPFAERLRELADAAHGQARVILLAQVAANQSWKPMEGAREIQLAAELEGDDRPGPAKLWAPTPSTGSARPRPRSPMRLTRPAPRSQRTMTIPSSRCRPGSSRRLTVKRGARRLDPSATAGT